MARTLTDEDIVRLRLRLLRNARLFDEPDAYRAGIDDAVDAIFVELSAAGVDAPTRRDAAGMR